MSTRTLAQIRAEAQSTADLDGSSVISEADWNRRINVARRALYDTLIDANGEDLFKIGRTITVSSGSETTDITKTLTDAGELGVLHLISMDASIGGRWVDLKPLYDWTARNDYQDASGWSDSVPVCYGIEGRAGTNDTDGPTIRWFPTPTENQSVRVFYVPSLADLSNDSDKMDGINGWEEEVVLSVAIWARIKLEDEVGELMAERAAVHDRIHRAAKRTRDTGHAIRVSDVRGHGHYWERYR